MKMAVLRFLLIAGIVLVSSCTTEEKNPSESILAENVISLEVQLADLLNKHRESRGLGELQLNVIAYEVANEHNDYMIAQGKLSHDNFKNRASKIYSGTNAKEIGENVGKNFQTAEEALDWWLNSTSHRENIESDFTHTAISVKKDGKGNLYYTNIFFK
ncbi:CAP domain-containing protein [Allomuricauda sp. d1]|uniref:CAP domain-containing protein n=1 Tax=Allomuricauda sp. d1 TaxID=3136725 RepID=UPI0031E3B3E4